MKNRRRCLGTVAVILLLMLEAGGCTGKTPEKPLLERSQEIQLEVPTEISSEIPTEESAAQPVEPAQEVPELHRRYDAREDGRTSPVKDQGDFGTCWAFASLQALESVLLPDQGWDFAEDHMSHNPHFNLAQSDGGEYTMSMAYLLSWQGPVREEDDPYGDGISPKDLNAVKHVQEIQLLPYRDFEVIKRAILESGGVQSSLYTTLSSQESKSEYYNRERSAYCYPTDTTPNHDVVIVGWDDDFPKEAFLTEAPEDGAFICVNSWGKRFGENGYFYVSYYDANIGNTNVLYSRIEEPGNYNAIYQSDLCGWIGQLGFGEDTAWAVNVYQAAGREQLAAAGFYAIFPDTDYQVYAVKDIPEKPVSADFEARILLAEGHLDYGGFYTISWERKVSLEPGERFGIMVCLTTPGAVHPIAIEYEAGDGKCQIDLSDGEGYISLEGKQWQSVEKEQRCNLCLKAYTRKR